MLDLGRVSSLFVYPKRFMYSMFTIEGKFVKHKRIIFPRKRKHVCDIYHARTVYRPYSQFNLTCFYRWNASFCAQRNPNHHMFPWFFHGFPMDFPEISDVLLIQRPKKETAPTVAPVPELRPRPSGCGDLCGALRQGLLNTGRVTSDEFPFFVYRWMNYKVVPPR